MDVFKRAGAVLLDLVFPSKCALCQKLGDSSICPGCKAAFARCYPPALELKASPVKAIHSLYHYEGLAAEAIKRLKYGRVTSLARLMADELHHYCIEAKLYKNVCIVPVPIANRRMRHRGFNQSELLSESMPAELLAPHLLKRVKYTKPQVGLNREQRLSNLMGAFRANQSVVGKNILLVDDVTTTGGTAIAAGTALRNAGARSIQMVTYCAERTGI